MKLFEVVLSLLSVISVQPEVRLLLQSPSEMNNIEPQVCVQLVEEELVRTAIVPGFQAGQFFEWALEDLSEAKNAEENAAEHYAIRFLRSCAPILYGGIYVHDDEIKDLNAHAHEHYLECLERELDRISIMENTQVYKEARVAQEVAKAADNAIHTISFRDKIEAAQLAYYNYFGNSEELYRQLLACNVDTVHTERNDTTVKSVYTTIYYTTDDQTKAVEQFKKASNEGDRAQAAEKLRDQAKSLQSTKDELIKGFIIPSCLEPSDAEIGLLNQTQLLSFFECVKSKASGDTTTAIIAAFETAIQNLKFDEARAEARKLIDHVQGIATPKPKPKLIYKPQKPQPQQPQPQQPQPQQPQSQQPQPIVSSSHGFNIMTLRRIIGLLAITFFGGMIIYFMFFDHESAIEEHSESPQKVNRSENAQQSKSNRSENAKDHIDSHDPSKMARSEKPQTASDTFSCRLSLAAALLATSLIL